MNALRTTEDAAIMLLVLTNQAPSIAPVIPDTTVMVSPAQVSHLFPQLLCFTRFTCRTPFVHNIHIADDKFYFIFTGIIFYFNIFFILSFPGNAVLQLHKGFHLFYCIAGIVIVCHLCAP